MWVQPLLTFSVQLWMDWRFGCLFSVTGWCYLLWFYLLPVWSLVAMWFWVGFDGFVVKCLLQERVVTMLESSYGFNILSAPDIKD